MRHTWGEKGAGPMLPQEFLKYKINFAGANFKYHSRTFFLSSCILFQCHSTQNTWSEKKLKFYTESVRAVPGVRTTVVCFSAISCLALNLTKIT